MQLQFTDNYLLAFTDGSASNGTHKYLARAGWGVNYGHNPKLNTNAPLKGPIQTSYRAEIRAVLHVIRTAVVPTHVWADCKGVVDTFLEIINNDQFDPEDRSDSDLWKIANELIKHAPLEFFKISWMNSHLEENGMMPNDRNLSMKAHCNNYTLTAT